MPIIKTKIINEKDFEVGKQYIIDSVEPFVSPEGQKGLKVSAHSTSTNDKSKYASILWTRDNVGINSKLGSFVSAFAKLNSETEEYEPTDSDTWIGETIKIVAWEKKDRKIVVM